MGSRHVTCATLLLHVMRARANYIAAPDLVYWVHYWICHVPTLSPIKNTAQQRREKQRISYAFRYSQEGNSRSLKIIYLRISE